MSLSLETLLAPHELDLMKQLDESKLQVLESFASLFFPLPCWDLNARNCLSRYLSDQGISIDDVYQERDKASDEHVLRLYEDRAWQAIPENAQVVEGQGEGWQQRRVSIFDDLDLYLAASSISSISSFLL